MALNLPPLRLLRPLTTGLLATCAALAAAVATVPGPVKPYDHIVVVTLRLPAAASSALSQENLQGTGVGPLPFLTELASDPQHSARLLSAATPPEAPADTLPPQHLSSAELESLLRSAGKSLISYPLDLAEVVGKTSAPAALLAGTADFQNLPTVALITPKPSPATAATLTQTDAWLRGVVGPYAQWSTDHNSLLIVLLERPPATSVGEPGHDGMPHEPVAALVYGARVQPGLQRNTFDAAGVMASVLQNQGLLGQLRRQLASRCSPTSDCDLDHWRPALGMI